MSQKQEARIFVEGMHCESCVMRLKTALKKLESVDLKDVQVGSADVAFDPSKTSLDQIASAIHRIGFRTEAHG
jgi:copper chaperone